MRITNNMRLNTTVGNMFNIQSQYNDLMGKIATQKKVNRASDDPIAATRIIDIRQGIAANEQYRKNITDSEAWISMTETTLSCVYDLLTEAKSIAVGETTATANEDSRKIAAKSIQSLIDQMAGLANTKLGDRYLFSGSKHGVAPFSTTPGEARIEAAEPAGNNVFKGTVESSATYSGTTDQYTLKITTGGSLAEATAQISTDGGANWKNTTEDGIDLSVAGAMAEVGGAIKFRDGVVLTFNDNGGTDTFAKDDTFVVNAYAEASVAVEPPPLGAPNTFTGTVTPSGTYSGTTNKTYTIRITSGNSLPGAATAQISTDGITWNDTTEGGTDLSVPGAIALPGGINLGDGVFLTFNDPTGTATFGATDTFVVNAFAKGSVAVEPPPLGAPNAFTGTVAPSVTYSGTTNKTYVVKITGNKDAQGDPTAGVATAQFSTDGGRNWNDTTLSVNGDINLGDNVKLTIDNAATATFGENDIFVVNAIAEGYYQGNNDQLSVTINRGGSIAYNITGEAAFKASGGVGVDVFKTLTDLKKALDDNDVPGISSQLENLRSVQGQIALNQSLCGTTASRIEMAKKNLDSLDQKLTSLLSDAQDADLAEYASRLSMQEIALQASYAMAARIGDMTILNFLK